MYQCMYICNLLISLFDIFIYLAKSNTDVIKRALPKVEIMINGPSGKKPPLLNAVRYGLTCKSCDSKFSFIDVNWSGVMFQKSVWVTQLEVKRDRICIERDLDFHPYLEHHMGAYTCHFTVRDNDGSTFVVNKTMNIKGKYNLSANYTKRYFC